MTRTYSEAVQMWGMHRLKVAQSDWRALGLDEAAEVQVDMLFRPECRCCEPEECRCSNANYSCARVLIQASGWSPLEIGYEEFDFAGTLREISVFADESVLH